MFIIHTEEDNNESMIINSASIICEHNKEFNLNIFDEKCINLSFYENRHMGVKGLLNHKKRQNISKMTRIRYYLQK